MRLGVVMAGVGADAAASAGALCALLKRGIEPYAVCGLGAGAWPAALYITGLEEEQMRSAAALCARMGRRMLRPGASVRGLLSGEATALVHAGRLERMLSAQAGNRLMGVCPRRGVLPCQMLHGARRVVFSSRPFAPVEDAWVTTQASISFGARAAMTAPPFLAPLCWMGAPLIADYDLAFGAKALRAMGAQAILVLLPARAPGHETDVLERTAGGFDGEAADLDAGVLQLMLPQSAGALSVEQIVPIMQAGETAAQRGLDDVLARMGMAMCRVLPFKRPIMQTGTR